MPLISTRGAASAVGFGVYAYRSPVVPVTPGTLAVFKYSNANTVKYFFATGLTQSQANAGTLSGDSRIGASNSELGIFGNSAGGVNTLQTYVFAGGTLSSGVSLSQAQRGSACGNVVQAIIVIHITQTTRKYTYATSTIVNGTNITALSNAGISAGNASVGIICPGQNTVTNKYTYADDTVAVGGVLTNINSFGAATSTADFALFALGVNGTVTNKYTFSSNTAAIATALKSPADNATMSGNDEMAIILLKSSSADLGVTNVYTYATNTTAAGTSLPSLNSSGTSISNGTTGVNL